MDPVAYIAVLAGVAAVIGVAFYREGVFEPGETIAVFGVGVREPDPAGVSAAEGYRGLPPSRLRMRHSPSSPLYLSDNPGTLA